MDIDELIPILDDPPPGSIKATRQQTWKVLVVDDDPEVLVATRLSLREIEILGRPIEILEATSASEARDHLLQTHNVAVLLLDVVMESTDAGLRLVKVIREDMGLKDLRIILRTGEPGYAPEIAVINNFDINDYKTKSELTQTRLITALTAAIRSYAYINVIHDHRRGLEKIVHASSALLEQQSLVEFAEGVLTQIAAVLQLPLDGLLCARRGFPIENGPREDTLYVLGAAGALAEFIARPLDDLAREEIIKAIYEAVSRQAHIFAETHTVLYLRNQAQEGAIYLESSRPLQREDRQLVEVFAANITACFANVGLFERLQHSAGHDALTGLPNRTRFLEHLSQDAGTTEELQVALLGISGFQEISDGLGLDIGDQVLVSLADRLTNHFGSDCRVARLGDDCFGVAGPASMVEPNRLVSLMDETLIAGEHSIHLGFHLGFCRADDSGGSSGTLLKRASLAMQAARLSGRPELFARFEQKMEEDTRSRLETIRELTRDFRNNRLQLWYQPQINLRTGRLASMEALLRWPAEQGFRHPPSVFVPLAESSGLINEIGAWALQQACADLAELQSHGPAAPPRVAVNVSQIQFRSGTLVSQVAAAIKRHGLAPGQLELEITESVAMDEPRVVIANLHALRELGVHLAIDDFGMGYSSLGYLRHLPLHALKIDRTFINEITDGTGILAEAIIRLGRQLGLEVIAEGVETDEQDTFLCAHHCDLVQGYRYARPMPLSALQSWLTHWHQRQPPGSSAPMES